MNRYKNLPGILLTAAVPALMSGCAVWTVVRALGFAVSPIAVYAVAFITAAAAALADRGVAWMIAAIAIPVGGSLLTVLIGGRQLNGFISAARAAGGISDDLTAAYAGAGNVLALLAALIFGALTALLFKTRSGKPFALLFPVAAILIALTLCREITLWAVLPGLAGCVAAFASASSLSRADLRPGALAACACIALAAIVIAPASGTTWEPLRKLAEEIRSTADEYVRFTEERVAYSINEKGYDHGGMISDTVVTMLGGAADPTDDEVMRVETDRDILLRGTIKQTYTGYSWVDDRAKARYLYYDFTHANIRNKIFGSEIIKNNAAFETVSVRVKMLESATSTLFVPAHMTGFDMDLADAVYYNSTGEVFLTREVAAGDTYSLTAQVPASDAALIEAAAAAQDKQDSGYAEAEAEYSGLPAGIDERVYAMAASITANCGSAVEKAIAIREYLASNYTYTLDAGFPDADEDFVSWFLLEDKKGYCSYFASAMAVLCRISGIPARYVEGYYVRAGGETVVTGHNAHAWVEIYLNGIGWTAFDPTAAAYGSQFGYPQDSSYAPNPDSGTGGDGGSAGTPFENDDSDLDASGSGTGSDDPGSDDSSDNGSDPSDGDSDSSDGSDDPSDGDGDSSDGGSDSSGDSGDEGNDSGSDGEDSGDQDGDAPDEGNNGSDNSDENEDPDNNDDNDPEDEQDPQSDPGEQNDSEKQFHAWIWILIAALILAALIAAAVFWIRRRLEVTDPLRMCKNCKSPRKASMILYRAILTLLVQLGYVPMNGETAEDFAARVCQSIPNDAYERFAAATARSVYSGGGLKRSELEDGRDAYLAFLAGMKRTERVRYDIRRVMHGIGDIESIP